jgi:ATP-binding cassette subfamily B multidrug efflux pump
MKYFEEEDDRAGKLYNRDVLRLLFSYLFRYKNHLISAFLLVFCIAGANLAVPYLFKTIVDRYIVKRGRIVDPARLAETEAGGFTRRRLERGGISHAVPLGDGTLFLYRSELTYLSQREIGELVDAGVLSRESYVLVEAAGIEGNLLAKLERLTAKGEILRFGSGIYLFKTDVLREFTVGELVLLRRGDFSQVLRYVLGIVGILLLQFGSSYIQIILLMKLSQRAMRDLRRELFAHTLTLEISFFDRNPVGKLVNRVTNDVEKLNELFSSVMVTLFQDLLMMLGITVIMFFTSYRMAMLFMISVPFLVVITVLFRIKVRKAYRSIRTRVSELNSFLNEIITGIRVVKVFVREAASLLTFGRFNHSLYEAHMRHLYIIAVFRPLIGFMRWFTIATIVYFGARGIADNRISFGLLVMFIAYIERFFHPIQDLSEKFDIMQNATAAGEKILSLFRAEARREEGVTERPARGEGRKTRRIAGDIEFRDVWFSYLPGEWVLKGVSFRVDPRETLAIVGETGAGKTSIINTLSRLYPIQRGEILIDGRNLEEIPPAEVRSNVVTVMQDIFLFSRTIRENIVLGNDGDDARFRQALEMTYVDRFVRSLPGRENEPVMERGVTFSAGERQLLSFARALYFDPAVLVLDEATSNIDTETEMRIQDAIARLTRGRTSIIIAHRLSTIRKADRILVLDNGRIVEQGTHRDLMEKRGLYHRFYSLQFGEL